MTPGKDSREINQPASRNIKQREKKHLKGRRSGGYATEDLVRLLQKQQLDRLDKLYDAVRTRPRYLDVRIYPSSLSFKRQYIK